MINNVRFLWIFISLALIAGVAHSQVPFYGRCPAIRGMSNFDLELYLGTWYEIKKYPFLFELGGKCITATYNLRNDGKVSVLNKQINAYTNRQSSIQGTATVLGSGELNVQFQSVPIPSSGTNYIVLDTDYDNYSVVYSCTDIFKILSGRIVWILTRDQYPRRWIIKHAENIITSIGLPLSVLTTTDQSSCPN